MFSNFVLSSSYFLFLTLFIFLSSTHAMSTYINTQRYFKISFKHHEKNKKDFFTFYACVYAPLVYIHKSYKLQSSYFEFKIYIFSLYIGRRDANGSVQAHNIGENKFLCFQRIKFTHTLSSRNEIVYDELKALGEHIKVGDFHIL